MGTFTHHVILVHGRKDRVENIQKIAKGMFDCPEHGYFLVTNVVVTINGFASFMIGPDGSKEEHKDSSSYDNKRQHFKKMCTLLASYGVDQYVDFVELITYDETSSEGPLITSTNIK